MLRRRRAVRLRRSCSPSRGSLARSSITSRRRTLRPIGEGRSPACAELLEERFGILKVLMTPSCTGAGARRAALRPPAGMRWSYRRTLRLDVNAFVRLGARGLRRGAARHAEHRPVAVETRSPADPRGLPIHSRGSVRHGRDLEVARTTGCRSSRRAQGVNALTRRASLDGDWHYSFTTPRTGLREGARCVSTTPADRARRDPRDKGPTAKFWARSTVHVVDVGSSCIPARSPAPSSRRNWKRWTRSKRGVAR